MPHSHLVSMLLGPGRSDADLKLMLALCNGSVDLEDPDELGETSALSWLSGCFSEIPESPLDSVNRDSHLKNLSQVLVKMGKCEEVPMPFAALYIRYDHHKVVFYHVKALQEKFGEDIVPVCLCFPKVLKPFLKTHTETHGEVLQQLRESAEKRLQDYANRSNKTVVLVAAVPSGGHAPHGFKDLGEVYFSHRQRKRVVVHAIKPKH